MKRILILFAACVMIFGAFRVAGEDSTIPLKKEQAKIQSLNVDKYTGGMVAAESTFTLADGATNFTAKIDGLKLTIHVKKGTLNILTLDDHLITKLNAGDIITFQGFVRKTPSFYMFPSLLTEGASLYLGPVVNLSAVIDSDNIIGLQDRSGKEVKVSKNKPATIRVAQKIVFDANKPSMTISSYSMPQGGVGVVQLKDGREFYYISTLDGKMEIHATQEIKLLLHAENLDGINAVIKLESDDAVLLGTLTDITVGDNGEIVLETNEPLNSIDGIAGVAELELQNSLSGEEQVLDISSSLGVSLSDNGNVTVVDLTGETSSEMTLNLATGINIGDVPSSAAAEDPGNVLITASVFADNN